MLIQIIEGNETSFAGHSKTILDPIPFYRESSLRENDFENAIVVNNNKTNHFI
jgi:hypothetical protein